MAIFKARRFSIAICLLLTYHQTCLAQVPTCDDINEALNASADFSKWRGEQVDDGEWQTSHSIFGFDTCVVTKRDFRCQQVPINSLELAKNSFTTFRDLLEKCLPKPEWIHKMGSDTLPKHGFLNIDGRNGSLYLMKTQQLKPGIDHLESQDIYALTLLIFERM